MTTAALKITLSKNNIFLLAEPILPYRLFSPCPFSGGLPVIVPSDGVFGAHLALRSELKRHGLRVELLRQQQRPETAHLMRAQSDSWMCFRGERIFVAGGRCVLGWVFRTEG